MIVPLLFILGVAAGALGWYARNSYYVGQNGNQVVIYKGVPGGVLGWNPTVDQRTGINIDQLQPVDREKVAANTSRGSLDSARSYVARAATDGCDADDDHNRRHDDHDDDRRRSARPPRRRVKAHDGSSRGRRCWPAAGAATSSRSVCSSWP